MVPSDLDLSFVVNSLKRQIEIEREIQGEKRKKKRKTVENIKKVNPYNKPIYEFLDIDALNEKLNNIFCKKYKYLRFCIIKQP